MIELTLQSLRIINNAIYVVIGVFIMASIEYPETRIISGIGLICSIIWLSFFSPYLTNQYSLEFIAEMKKKNEIR